MITIHFSLVACLSSGDSLTTTEDHALSNKVTIAVVVVCLVILAVVLGSVLVSGLLCYLCCGRGGVNCREADLGAARNVFIGNRCSAIVPPGKDCMHVVSCGDSLDTKRTTSLWDIALERIALWPVECNVTSVYYQVPINPIESDYPMSNWFN